MVNLTTSIAVPNITKFDGLGKLDFGSGALDLRLYYGAGTPPTRFQDFTLTLSDTAGRSRGLYLNAAPQSPDDTYVMGSGGVINALANAQAAYRGAANHNAGIKGVLLRGVTDGWLDATLAGS